MNKIAIILISSILFSCATPRVLYKYIEKDVYCPSTAVPEFLDYDYNKQLLSQENLHVLLENSRLLSEYTEKLKSEIKCYKKQTNSKKQTTNK